MHSGKRKYAVSLMLDHGRHEMLRAAKNRRFSMSELVRAFADRLMRETATRTPRTGTRSTS
jgi:hypothetical protein